MKTRNGFVSNSSSSSFLIAVPIKEQQGIDFTNDSLQNLFDRIDLPVVDSNNGEYTVKGYYDQNIKVKIAPEIDEYLKSNAHMLFEFIMITVDNKSTKKDLLRLINSTPFHSFCLDDIELIEELD